MNVTITVTKDTASPMLEAQMAALNPHRIATRIAPPLAQYWRNYLVHMPKNKNGYPSTGFWEDAARKVTGIALGDGALISCGKLGIRQRYYGGTIAAVNTKYLTIPITAESYGTTAKDWGDQLVPVRLSDGRWFLALWLGSDAAQEAYRSAGIGRPASRSEITTRRAQRFGASGLEKPEVIIFKQKGSSSASEFQRSEKNMNLKFLFKLQDEVDQEGNSKVIPPDFKKIARAEVLKAVTIEGGHKL